MSRQQAAFADYREVPESNGTNAALAIVSLPVSLGVDMTDRSSVGASMAMGIAFFDGPFVGLAGMTPDYALRGTAGTNYQLSETTSIGGYYQTKQSYTFDNAFSIDSPLLSTTRDAEMDLPQNLGFGVANSSLLDGRLLLACDVVYKLWDEADLYIAVYENQWVVQFGSQLTHGRYRLRAGYVWADSPIDNTPGPSLGGIVDVLPGVDSDAMAGGMFEDVEPLGDFTSTSIESYWLGFGLTWRFGGGDCGPPAATDDWCQY